MTPPPTKALPWQPLLDFLKSKGSGFAVSGLKGSSPAYLLSQIAPGVRAPIVFLTLDETRPNSGPRRSAFLQIRPRRCFYTLPGTSSPSKTSPLLPRSWDSAGR